MLFLRMPIQDMLSEQLRKLKARPGIAAGVIPLTGFVNSTVSEMTNALPFDKITLLAPSSETGGSETELRMEFLTSHTLLDTSDIGDEIIEMLDAFDDTSRQLLDPVISIGEN